MRHSIRNSIIKLIISAVMTTIAGVSANQPGQLVTNADLKKEPSTKAKTVSELKRGDSVEILSREGGWYATQADKKSGWVRMLHIRMLGNDASTTSQTTSSVFSAGRGQSAIATGIRGLTEENLKNANADFNELKKLDAWQADSKSAETFARAGKLNSKGAKK